MDREQAKDFIKAEVSCEQFLTKSKGADMYNCPYCHSGTGDNKTGAAKFYKESNTIYCHACNKGGDVIALYQQLYSVDFNEALEQLAEIAGVSIDKFEAQNRPQEARSSSDNKDITQNTANGSQSVTESQIDLISYYQQCADQIEDPAAISYLEKRGLSIDTAKAYMIGFDPKADPAQSNHPTPRIIIPCSRSHYVARAIDDSRTPAAFRKLNNKGSTPAIFNSKAIKSSSKYIFVAEAAIDALSIIEAGSTAIGLNSTGNAEKLIDLLKEYKPKATFILCCDNDAAGKSATDKIAAGCNKIGIRYMIANICGNHKDPNEALTADRKSFIDSVEKTKAQAMDRPDNTAYYIDHMMQDDIEKDKSDKKTGFDNLDMISGGIYNGLYCIAAASSLGKTTFSLQIADQLAAAGNDVIYFSLEQSRLEMVTKSLARQTAIDSKNKDKHDALSSINIRKNNANKQQRDLLQTAILNYKYNVSSRMSIVEGNFNCDITFISNYIEQYMSRTGTRPVVFIDYLQILQPTEENKYNNAKATVDAAITQLKQMSRDLKIAIFTISSINRAGYLQPIDFESLKESGNIEFTCDVVWGLQLNCLNEDLFLTDDKKTLSTKRARIKAARKENPRQIQLCCIKNRYGISSYECKFDYYPQFDLFVEKAETLAKQADSRPRRII